MSYRSLPSIPTRFELGDDQFERVLPSEIRAELEAEPPRSLEREAPQSLPSPVMERPAQASFAEPPPLVMPPEVKLIQQTPRSNNALGLLLGVLALPILIALLIPVVTGLHQLGTCDRQSLLDLDAAGWSALRFVG